MWDMHSKPGLPGDSRSPAGNGTSFQRDPRCATQTLSCCANAGDAPASNLSTNERSRMPRAGLTTLRVVEEAGEVADDLGLDNLTMAAIAPRLGVTVPSLYKHVAGMNALQRLVSIRAKAEIGDVLARATAGKSGSQALAGLAHAYRAWAKKHPGRYATVLRAPDSDDLEDVAVSRDALEIIFAALSSYGLEGDDEINAVRMLRATLHGFVTLELASAFGMPNDVELSFDLLIAGLDLTLSNWPPQLHDARPERGPRSTD